MLNFIYMRKITIGADFALLIARLIIGGIFIYAGWMKVVDIQTTVGIFNSLNIPSFFTYLVSYGELIGGILLALGICTSFVSLFLSTIMIVAVFLSRMGGMEMFGTPLVILAGLISIWGNGAGKYRMFRK
jgi:putative oxidoreductase